MEATGRSVRANATEIYFEESGEGHPLILLHGATVSTSEVWADFPWSWRRFVPSFAEYFRVIAVDTRGHGKTPNPGGEAVSYDVFADDIVALSTALGLEHPLLCGFSDGGHAASMVAMREPGLPAAVVNYAGYDMFNPRAPSAVAVRTRQGGRADATTPELDGIEERIGSARYALIVKDHDAVQGEGAWRGMFQSGFDRWTQPGAETFADFARITAPTLIEVGDRDPFCTIEEGCEVFRQLPNGELCVLPNLDHSITQAVADTAIEFLLRHQ